MVLFPIVVLALAQPGPAWPPLQCEPLVGVVVDADGAPASGTEVLLSSGRSESEDLPLIGGALWMSNPRDAIPRRPGVMGRSRTDDIGRFRIELPAEVVQSQESLPVVLWAIRPGGRVACQRLPWAIPAPSAPVRLAIKPPAPTAFRVVGPDGRPAPGARVVVSDLERLTVPAELADRFGAEAGPDGVAVIAGFALAEIRAVRVESSRFGTQRIHVEEPNAGGPATVALEPTGHILGRVHTDLEKPVPGLTVRIQTSPQDFDPDGTVGSAEVITDASGAFEIAAITAGRLTVVLDFRSRPDVAYRGLPPANQVVEAGRSTTFDIRLKPAVRIDGLIRERGTGLPIAGVSPEIPDPASHLGGNPKVVTDTAGRFTGYMERDQPYAVLYTTPKPYVVPSDAPDALQLLPAGATSFTLPPTELVRGNGLRGSVVDDTGKVVAGALVRASWGGKGSVLQSVATRTDARGIFLLEGLDPLADLRLRAEAEGRATAEPYAARAGGDAPVKLVLTRARTVVLAGKLVDVAGKPIMGAQVKIRSQTRTPDGRVWRSDPVHFGEQDELRSDADGRFRTPYGVPSDVEYDASARMRGILPAQTVWLKPGDGGRAVFKDLTLRRIQTVRGVVRDGQGRPIEGADVFQSGDGPIRTRTRSDNDGRFQLPGVIEGKVILFARKEGFRFHGQPIDTEAGGAELRLMRTDETPAPLKTLSSVLPPHEELALARRMLSPYVEQVMAKGDDTTKFQVLLSLAPIDPTRTLEFIDTQGTGKPVFILDQLRSVIAVGLAGESPEEAASIAETIKDPATRSWSFTEIVDKLPARARAQKVELLAQAQLQAGGSSQPGLKLRVLGRTAERWLDLGETERAQNLLRECRELAKTIPPPAYEVVAFAESLARVDLEASLTLIAAARDSAKRGDRVNRVFVFDRSYGEIAYRLARSDPAGAERVLGLITSAFRRDGYIVAACARMALADYSRSQRVAATIDDPFLRAYAWGAIAGSLSATDKAAAARMLDQAFDDLEKHRDHREGHSRASCVAAVLLEAVERLDPARLQESVWRAVALRAPRIDDAGVGWTGRDEAELALNLARYDRAAAAAVLAPAVAAFGTTDVDTHRQAFIAMALVLIDPLRAVSMVEALPDDPGLDYTLPKNAAQKMAAEMLAKHGDDRWKAAREWAVSIWRPVGSDL